MSFPFETHHERRVFRDLTAERKETLQHALRGSLPRLTLRAMSIVLYHHPFSRASNVVWMLEEIGVPYELRHVDIMKGEQKSSELTKLNPMGKIPVLTDGDTVVSESAAIALYLADRYSYGALAPKIDDPRRGPYLRWTLFCPSVVEPAAAAKHGKWDAKPGSVGWGTYENMVQTMESALHGSDYVAGSEFTMADVVFGGTLRYMTMFQMIEPKPAFAAYLDRVSARPGCKRAEAKNAESREAHGLNK